ncbi:MAG: malate dehydrogenase (quinone) [Wolinella sp.]
MKNVDVLLIGGGVMSATLGMLLRELEPSWSILLLERLDSVAYESSDAWNNAGTGHQALCELNYTPELQGRIDISRAVKINESFEVSKQFWAYHVNAGNLREPSSFLNPLPHMSFVMDGNVEYLRTRFSALKENPLFHGMRYSEDMDEIATWAELLINGRDRSQMVAATRIDIGTDVDFGALSKQFCTCMEQKGNFALKTNHEVIDIKRASDGRWKVKAKRLDNDEFVQFESRFVFIGAGGAALPLLAKSAIPEARGYGGFPVSGQWLVCSHYETINKHNAKVYGKAAVGAPPMSVPHLDTRFINGEQKLLFGPFAGFSPNFLKNGSKLDMFRSINSENLRSMFEAGIDNIPLTKYLISQVLLSHKKRVDMLKKYVPEACAEDWDLRIAGQRVQIIKPDPRSGRGVLQFGTEVITSSDGTLSALLGASPGASTAVEAMLDVLRRCFKAEFNSSCWQDKIREMIPSYGMRLSDNVAKLNENRKYTSKALGIPFDEA